MTGDLDKKIDDFVQKLQCRSQGAYPPVKVGQPNPREAQKLLDAYGGPTGELTAVTQYFDHYLRFGQGPEAGLELCVCLSEMRHLDLIGDIVSKLGVRPTYVCSKNNAWTADYVHYGEDMPDAAAADAIGISDAGSQGAGSAGAAGTAGSAASPGQLSDQQKAALLRVDAKIEKDAIAFYDRMIRDVKEPEVAAVLERINADEKEHLRLFTEAADRLEGKG